MMKTKLLDVYNDTVNGSVNNQYPTLQDEFVQPCLWYMVGTRTSGKSFLTSKFLKQSQKHDLFDRIYIVTPSFNSNKSYFKDYIHEEDIYEPTGSSISEVIAEVEAERDEWERYLEDVEMYKQFKRDIPKTDHVDDETILTYHEKSFFEKKPEWKYGSIEPPKSLLILDDIIGSPAIANGSGLNKIATLNRHLAPLKDDFIDKKGNVRSACGLAVIILSQSYRFQNGIGRILRENLSLLTLFANKQEKQMSVIKEELGSVIDEDLFEKAYEYATAKPYGNLTIEFQPKCKTKVFRKNLNEVICFEELGKCECKK